VLRPDGSVDWTKYHNSDDAETLLREIVAKYPDIAKMYSIGRSFKGKELWLLELSNRKTKPAEDKPGYYIDGGVHSCELTGAEQVLYLAWYFSNKYGQEPAVTRLLDTRVLYLRPKFNPDGADYCLTHPDSLRSTVRPWDDDGDGQADEDPAEDLDGDGAITQMRVKSANGTHKISSDDPRLMLERRLGESGGEYYLLLSEGIDNDGDGQFNEDGVGGIDMNRNFPRTWGLPYEQSGAGPFPLSEPETRATLDFLVAHPNVTGIVHNHTAGGFLYRLPSTNPASDHEADDLELVKMFGNEYTRVTGHEVHDSYVGEGSSRHGTLISWGYFDYWRDRLGARALGRVRQGLRRRQARERARAAALERRGAGRHRLHAVEGVHPPAAGQARDRRLEAQVHAAEPTAEDARERDRDEGAVVRLHREQRAAAAPDRRKGDGPRRRAVPSSRRSSRTTATCRRTSPSAQSRPSWRSPCARA
jgi:hypothetical protein